MASISDIARAVLNRDKAAEGENVTGRLTAAVDAYGIKRPDPPGAPTPPAKSRPAPAEPEQAVETDQPAVPLVPATREAARPERRVGELLPDAKQAPAPADEAIGRAREQLLQAVLQVAAEIESGRSGAPAALRYEALEIAPLTERMTVMDTLFEQLVHELEAVKREVGRGRSDHVEDLTLLIDLITTSWRTVDRRLGRIERKLERLEQTAAQDADRTVVRVIEPQSGDSPS